MRARLGRWTIEVDHACLDDALKAPPSERFRGLFPQVAARPYSPVTIRSPGWGHHGGRELGVTDHLTPIGFWSYTSSDDSNSNGKLSQLRVLLSKELQLRIGQQPKVRIFQDVATIPHGRKWTEEIERALGQSSFLIPIVTPAFLQSSMCCLEVKRFIERERELGRSDLIFPFHYIETTDVDPRRREECHDPEVLRTLRDRQWLDFRDLRFREPGGEDVSSRVSQLAGSIREALRRPAVANLAMPVADAGTADHNPGAASEVAPPAMPPARGLEVEPDASRPTRHPEPVPSNSLGPVQGPRPGRGMSPWLWGLVAAILVVGGVAAVLRLIRPPPVPSMPEPPIMASPGSLEIERIAPPDPAVPTSVRVTGAGSPPSSRIYVAVRKDGSVETSIRGEVLYDGDGHWSATIPLDNSYCRNNPDGVTKDHLVYWISMLAYQATDTVVIGEPPPIQAVRSTGEMAYRLKC